MSPALQRKLHLVVKPDTGTSFDHADWAGARLLTGQAVPPPLAATGLTATFNSGTNKVDLKWNDIATDEAGYYVERKTGINGTYASITTLPANSTTFSDGINLVSGTTYYYRVDAYKVGATTPGVDQPSVTIPTLPGTYYLSDLPISVNSNGWGPAELDRSNGETGASDGHTITLNGVTYAKGIGVHATSDITYNLNGQYTTFFSDVGVDDEVGNNGTVEFFVYVDGVLKFDEWPDDRARAATQSLGNGPGIDVTGAQQLHLVVKPGYRHQLRPRRLGRCKTDGLTALSLFQQTILINPWLTRRS